MRSVDIQTVRDLPLFADMEEEQFDALMNAAFLQRFPAQAQLIQEGEPADFLHIIVEGLVEMYARRDNARTGETETTIGFLKPVTTFILAAVLTDKIYLQSARTLVPSRILMIPAKAMRGVFVRDASFTRAVVADLAERYRDMVREVKSQKMRSGLERLAAWIIAHGEARGGELVVAIPYEKAKLASFLGMTRENLSRSFAALGDHGVKVAGRIITCARPEALRALARPDRLMDGT